MRFKALLIALLLTSHLSARPSFEEPWGRDSGLKAPPTDQTVSKPSFGTRVADVIIRFHQEVISPVDGPRSSFRPTSSRYMQLAMQRYGFFKGFIMGFDRLLRENDEEWVYRTVEVDGRRFKFDPAIENKYLPAKSNTAR